MPKTLGTYFGFTREWILTIISVMNTLSMETAIDFNDLLNDPTMKGVILDRCNEVVHQTGGASSKNTIMPEDVVSLFAQL